MEEEEEEKGREGGEADAKAEEERRLLEGMTVLDFDMLCSAVAMQTQGKWGYVGGGGEEEGGGRGGGGFGEVGGVLRMWEGEALDCLDDRRLALQSAWLFWCFIWSCCVDWIWTILRTSCPCYIFGKNMNRAGFGFVQGTLHLVLVLCALANVIAFAATRRHYFLYLAVSFTLSVGAYLGFFRMQMRKKFNIKGSDSYLDDCFFHLICPCCTLSQEARTLEINNVQDGTWHGRGDTICIASYGDGSKQFVELDLKPPHISSMKTKCSIGC